MHCGTCYKKFSLMRTRKQCSECRRYYCKYCVMRKANKNINCENCAVLTSRPLNKTQLLKLKARDLQVYLANKQVSTKGCIEKEDLVNLLLAHASGNTDVPTDSNCPDDQSNPTRQLFKNLRSFFSSTPDVSSNVPRSEPNYSNPTVSTTEHSSNSTQSTPNSAQRVYYHPRPPYYNPVSPTEPNPVVPNVPVTPAEEATASSDVSVESGQSSILLPPFIANVIQSETSNSDSETESVNLTLSNNSELTSSERDILWNSSNIFTNESFHNLKLSDIKSQSDLNELSIQQLKCLLLKNRVDFKGCVEKAELLERVQRLWTEYSQSREGLEGLPIDDLCKICMDAPIECVMLECGHMATCTLCGKQLSECPICRQYVVRVVRTFRA